jgi:hypothetical protein
MPLEYNYRTKAEIEASGFPVPDWEQPFDLLARCHESVWDVHWRRRGESNPCTRLCRPLPKPLGHAAEGRPP